MREKLVKDQLIAKEDAYKIGKVTQGISALLPSKDGKKVEPAVIVYTRKAEYKNDPFEN